MQSRLKKSFQQWFLPDTYTVEGHFDIACIQGGCPLIGADGVGKVLKTCVQLNSQVLILHQKSEHKNKCQSLLLSEYFCSYNP